MDWKMSARYCDDETLCLWAKAEDGGRVDCIVKISGNVTFTRPLNIHHLKDSFDSILDHAIRYFGEQWGG